MLGLLFVAIVLFVIADYTEYERRNADKDFDKKEAARIAAEYVGRCHEIETMRRFK